MRFCIPLQFALLVGAAHAQTSGWISGYAAPGLGGPVRAIAGFDPDGNGPMPTELVVGGSFLTAGESPASRVARWNGSAWSAMGDGMNSTVKALAVLQNGDIVAGGEFTSAGGLPAQYIARWNGTSWSSMGEGMNGYVDSLITLPSGELVAGGNFTTAGGGSARSIAIWNGTSWSALGAGRSEISALAIRPNGRIVAGGGFGVISEWDGANWTAMSTDQFGRIYAMKTLPNGDLVVVGDSGVVRGSGSTLSSVGAGVHAVYAVTHLSNGDIVAAGDTPMKRWNGTGWSDMGAQMGADVYALTTLANGDILAVGDFVTAGGSSANRIACYRTSLWLGPSGSEQRIDCNAGNVYVGTSLFANPVIRSDVVDMANSGRTIAFHAFAGTPTNAARTTAIWGETNNPNGRGLQGFNFATGPWTGAPSAGLWGESASSNGQGVRARATSTTGQNYAGYFDSASNAGTAVYATATSASGTTYRVWGNVASASGFAGYFTGGKNYFAGNVGIGTNAPSAKLHVIGTLTALGVKNFLIDHPTDSRNMILRHSCIESDGYKNIYDGIVRTDSQGYSKVQLPEWFCDLNKNFRYYLTVLDETDEVWPIATVAKKIDRNTFTIRTLLPNTEVSWQITATRKDAWARANPLVSEDRKTQVPIRRSPEIPTEFPLIPATFGGK